MIDTSKARSAIFERIRAGKPQPVEAPEVPAYGWPGDKVANFIKQLEAFDGRAQRFDSRADAIAWLEKNVDWRNKRVCSQLPDFKGSVSAADYPDPHKCTDISATVVESHLGVGEMGSLYLTDAELGGVPAIALLCLDLFVLINEADIVDGLHTAYAAVKDTMREQPYACFFSGPSATADIEAVHVTGAQGATSLTALIYKDTAH
ncbi:MAG: LUD domain-containing protein [Bacteroidales bacterium]|nr:LUD domain-containing protein [Bacteroidales bacterium]